MRKFYCCQEYIDKYLTKGLHQPAWTDITPCDLKIRIPKCTLIYGTYILYNAVTQKYSDGNNSYGKKTTKVLIATTTLKGYLGDTAYVFIPTTIRDYYYVISERFVISI